MNDNSRLADPCLPIGYEDEYNTGDKHYNLSIKAQEMFAGRNKIYFRGTGQWKQCYSLLQDFTRQTREQCVTERPCPNAGIEVSLDENSEFYGFAEFWYSVEDILGLGGPYSHKQFEAAAKVSRGRTVLSMFVNRIFCRHSAKLRGQEPGKNLRMESIQKLTKSDFKLSALRVLGFL
jgi:Golgi nucleoside diphosphatase